MSATRTVTLHAVIQRINRKLAPDLEQLRTSRSSRARFDLGDYYVHNNQALNIIAETYVDREECARELGVLKPSETISGVGVQSGALLVGPERSRSLSGPFHVSRRLLALRHRLTRRRGGGGGQRKLMVPS